MIHDACPIVDPIIYSCTNELDRMNTFEAELDKQYENMPLVVIHNTNQSDLIVNFLNKRNYRHIVYADTDSLNVIREWDYGVLLIDPTSARGTDTRFRRDAFVMIVSAVSSYHELQQMMGRSSRTRKVSQGALFVVGDEKSNRIIERLKSHGVTSLQSLCKLLMVLKSKPRDSALLKEMLRLKEENIVIKDYETFKHHIPEATLAKLLKGVDI